MPALEDLEKTLGDLQYLVDGGRPYLKSFNEPEWPEALELVFESVDATVAKHADGIRTGLVDDYINIAALLSQLEWPKEERSDEDRDKRLSDVRGIVGNIRIDIDRIIYLAGELGVATPAGWETLPVGTAMLSRSGHGGMLSALRKRLVRIELALNNEISEHMNTGTSTVQAKLVDYYVRSVRTDLKVAEASLLLGQNVDLGVIERASISVLDATGRMVATVGASVSRASEGLKRAVGRLREPVRRFAKGVRTFLRFALHEGAQGEQGELGWSEDSQPTAGELLRAAREGRGLSIEDVAVSSRIAHRFLTALENNDFSPFSAEHYILGFGKSFAKAVHYDAEKISSILRRQLRRSGFVAQSNLSNVYWSSQPKTDNLSWGPPRLDPIPRPRRVGPKPRDEDRKEDS